MRVHILGGGPAGLYLGILLKKRDPSRDIVVTERNAAGDTFGWGVVFSDETLGNLETADAESYRAITEEFVRWTSIDVYVKGEVHRSGGHGFCGIARKKLLNILQDRARALGVTLQFQTERTDIEALRGECDLLVAADGLRSLVRTQYESVFRPSLDVRKCRYVWLGTRQKFDAFTFSFRENEHGLFQIHSYPFDRDTGTMIVECDEETFQRSGLERATEADTIRYCEKLFAPDLGGHPLMSNRSLWVQFTTVKNERWVHENVVLLGDAAHTAHFSIGSGTKLAMEDSIALADAMSVPGRSLPESLSAYEDDRKPLVGRTQTAAQQSLEWFEQSKRAHHALPVPQFVFSLLTRSRRITHENLRLRDPGFVSGLDRFFEARAGSTAGPTPRPPMFNAFRLRELELVNRVVVSPMCQYSSDAGLPDDWHLVHIGSRAIGGAGLVMTEMTNVSPEARITPGCTGIWSDAHAQAWKRIVDFVHTESDAKIGLQLGHAGRKGSTKLLWEGYDEPLDPASGDPDNWEIVGPSPLAYNEAKNNQVPREMTRADMVEVIDRFVSATKHAITAGFDLLEVHMAHGYLLATFLTPIVNVRTDAYGGSLANRMRFPLEVFDAVRATWPKERPLSVRLSATDWVPGGIEAADSVEIARALKEHGCDVIDVSTGQTSPLEKPVYGRAFQTPFSERIRNEVGIPTIAVGNIPDFDQVNSIVLAGRADLVALARPHLFDPYFTLHAAATQGYEGVRWPKPYLAARPKRR